MTNCDDKKQKMKCYIQNKKQKQKERKKKLL